MKDIVEKASLKSDHEITSHGFETGSSTNDKEWFQGNGLYRGSLTTIRPKSSRKVYYNQIRGEMAHCVVLDLDNTALIRDEAVRNGETYKLMRYDGMIFLDIHIATTQPMTTIATTQPMTTITTTQPTIQQDSTG